jgi:hypothetical protein
MSKHNILRISSHEKTESSESNTNFTVNYSNDDATSSITRLILKSIDIPNVFYNINNGNNKFTYRTGVLNTITIPEGQYTLDELITALESQTTSIGMTIALSPLTKKLIFTFTSAAEMLSVSDGNNMGDVLGIKTSSSGTTYTAQNFPDLSGIQEIYIVSQSLSDGSNLIAPGGKCLPILAQIPITVDFGEIQHYSSNSPELDDVIFPSLRFGTNLRNISIQIVDRYGNQLDIGGLNLTIIIKVFHNSP